MSKDWQKGSGYVKEPKVTGIIGKNKDGYGDAKVIEATNPTESQTVTVKGTRALRKDKKPGGKLRFYPHRMREMTYKGVLNTDIYFEKFNLIKYRDYLF